MRRLFALTIVLSLVVPIVMSLSGATALAQDSVTVTILPGPFTADLEVRDDEVVLIVNDATGSGQGWKVQVSCTCPIQPIGEVIVVEGQAVDPVHGPRLVGTTLSADPDFGMGHYEQRFVANRGSWTATVVNDSP